MKQPDIITGNVNSKSVKQTMMNVFNLATEVPDKRVQPFDAFSMGVLMAYMEERGEDFDAFVKERLE